MRILLVSPCEPKPARREAAWIPLGLPFIAASLRVRGHEVALLDRYAEMAGDYPDIRRADVSMLNSVRDFRPDIVGFSTVSPLIYDTVNCVKLIRDFFKGIIIAGGYNATAMPADTLEKIPGLDGLLAGEGEEALCSLAGGEDHANIQGMWWREVSKIHAPALPFARVAELDRLPLPAYDLLDMMMYTRRSVIPVRGHYLSSVSLLTSRGCRFRCRFCSESLTFGGGVRFHSPEYVLEWIRFLVHNYPHIDGLYLHDNDFLADPARAAAICEKLISAGLHRRLSWAIQSRADHLKQFPLDLLKRAGCSLVELGVEGCSDALLAKMNKGIKVDSNEKAVAACHAAGLAVHAYMLTRTEDETIQDLTERLQWLKKVKADTFSWHPLKIYPGTALYRDHGEAFFEHNEWTQENVERYYGTDQLSTIDPKERKRWMDEHYRPYARLSWRLNILRRNGLRGLFLFFWHKLLDRIPK
jgi:radical SAM superfamily enzyme YgiQ (UPF0313 family)